MTPEDRAFKVCEKLFGHRWQECDEDDQQSVVDRFEPIAAAIREAVAVERERCAKKDARIAALEAEVAALCAELAARPMPRVTGLRLAPTTPPNPNACPLSPRCVLVAQHAGKCLEDRQ